MIHQMFTVYDSKAEAYLRPFFSATRGEAIRNFTDSCNDEGSQLYRHAGDFTLFYIGIYDDATALVSSEAHINLGKAIEFIAQAKE